MRAPIDLIPANYDSLSLDMKGIIWFGTLIHFEHPENFNKDEWEEIIIISEHTIFEDDKIRLTVGYGGEYGIEYKNGNTGFTGGFSDFFIEYDEWEYLNLEVNLGHNYKGISLSKYIRQSGFPIISEFWTWEKGRRILPEE